MSLQTETRTLGDERDRLDEAVDDLAEKLAKADGSASAQKLRSQANEVDLQGRGVAYLIEEFSADAEITVRGLNAGEFARVEDRVADIRARRDGGQAPGAHRNVYAAMGLLDAPFFNPDDDLTNKERVDEAIAAVSDQPIGVVKWLYALVDDLTTVDEGNWTSFEDRLRDRQSS